MPAMQQSVEDLEVIYDKVRADSRFSLYHLRGVDAAIDVATNVRNDAETTERAIKTVLERLAKSGGHDAPIDPENKLAPISASAEAAVRQTICALQESREAWVQSPISEEHGEEVSERIEEAIGSLKKLHDEMVNVRWAVMEHDADLEEPEGTKFDNADSLIADLRSR